jgi:hypothetical protein
MHTTMKDSLNHLMRDRFQGHEAPVDPAVWQVIEARLLTSAPAGQDKVNELLRERFAQHEASVPPAAWANIAHRLGHSAAGAGAGTWGLVAAGIAGAALVAGLWFANGDGAPSLTEQPAVEQAAPALPASAPSAEAQAVVPPTPEEVRNAAQQPRSAGARSHGAVRPGASVTTPGAAESEGAAAMGAAPAAVAVQPEVVEDIIAEITEQAQTRALQEQAAVQQKKTVPSTGSTASAEPEETRTDPTNERVELFMPNTFTPNGDGQNDSYRIVANVPYSSMLVRVYSINTNQLVFSSNSSEPWSGQGCEDGMYLVAVELITLEGRSVTEGKVVWLNRKGMN